MARTRLIKPGFFTNEVLAQCSLWARLLYAGLWVIADREGRLEDRPNKIRAEVFPYDEVDVESALCELADRGFICRYIVNDFRCILILRFLDHQHPHCKEPHSKLPKPAQDVAQCKHSASPVQAQCKPSASTVQAQCKVSAVHQPCTNLAPTLHQPRPSVIDTVIDTVIDAAAAAKAIAVPNIAAAAADFEFSQKQEKKNGRPLTTPPGYEQTSAIPPGETWKLTTPPGEGLASTTPPGETAFVFSELVEALVVRGLSPTLAQRHVAEIADPALLREILGYYDRKLARHKFRNPIGALRGMCEAPDRWGFHWTDQGWRSPSDDSEAGATPPETVAERLIRLQREQAESRACAAKVRTEQKEAVREPFSLRQAIDKAVRRAANGHGEAPPLS